MPQGSTYRELKEFLDAKNVQLVAVSKTKPVEQIMELYDQGQRIFGENRVEELVQKHPVMPDDIVWHMIGHLQSKKVKRIAPFVAMIHSVDSIKLLEVINREAIKNERIIDVLLQFKIASEETKYGLSTNDLSELPDFNDYPGVGVRGVMGMASFVEDESVVRGEFARLKSAFSSLKQGQFENDASFDTISMGMSGDYQVAIEQGSTMVRIGSMLFGPRN